MSRVVNIIIYSQRVAGGGIATIDVVLNGLTGQEESHFMISNA